MMVITWQIEEAVIVRLVRPAGHASAEIAHVNAVLTHVEKDENFGWARIGEFGLFAVDFVVAEGRAPITVGSAPTAQENIHGHAANARFLFASIKGNIGAIGWTFPNAEALAAVRPHGALGDVLVRIPIGGVSGAEVEGACYPRGGCRLREPRSFASEQQSI